MSSSANHESSIPSQPPVLTTIDGGTDFSEVSPGDLLVHRGPRTGRTILIEAGIALTAGRQPAEDAPDGATERLDGRYATKLDGRVLGISVSDQDLKK